MTDFDERSGIVPCQTPWGKWWQTIDDVFMEIPVPDGTKSKEIKVEFKPKYLKVVISGAILIDVSLLQKEVDKSRVTLMITSIHIGGVNLHTRQDLL